MSEAPLYGNANSQARSSRHARQPPEKRYNVSNKTPTDSPSFPWKDPLVQDPSETNRRQIGDNEVNEAGDGGSLETTPLKASPSRPTAQPLVDRRR